MPEHGGGLDVIAVASRRATVIDEVIVGVVE